MLCSVMTARSVTICAVTMVWCRWVGYLCMSLCTKKCNSMGMTRWS
eukprot:gene4598-18582_t